MRYLFIVLLLGCGSVSKQQHEQNAIDVAKYSAEVSACITHNGQLATCQEYLACKCVLDQKYGIDTGACNGHFDDGSTC